MKTSTASEKVQQQLQLRTLHSEFEESAESVVKLLVDELRLPEAERRYQVRSDQGGIAGGMKYIEQGLFFKVQYLFLSPIMFPFLAYFILVPAS